MKREDPWHPYFEPRDELEPRRLKRSRRNRRRTYQRVLQRLVALLAKLRRR